MSECHCQNINFCKKIKTNQLFRHGIDNCCLTPSQPWRSYQVISYQAWELEFKVKTSETRVVFGHSKAKNWFTASASKIQIGSENDYFEKRKKKAIWILFFPLWILFPPSEIVGFPLKITDPRRVPMPAVVRKFNQPPGLLSLTLDHALSIKKGHNHITVKQNVFLPQVQILTQWLTIQYTFHHGGSKKFTENEVEWAGKAETT